MINSLTPDLIEYFVEDIIFSAIAAIGFGSISNVPTTAFKGNAMLGAIGHLTRDILIKVFGMHIAFSSFFGALIIGFIAPKLGRRWRIPASVLAYPALLPMIPGMYAYNTVVGLMNILDARKNEELFHHAFYTFAHSGIVCLVVILMLVIGVLVPIHTDYKYHK